MFLLKRKYFYYLVIITTVVLMGYSVWGYYALMNNGGYQSFEIKYIAECFIFSALLLISLVCGLFIYLFHKSTDIYKELDKINELFDKGNYYTQNSFKKLGPLGTRILGINRHLVSLNDLKTKKISYDSKVINFLLNHTIHEILLFKNNGIVAKASKVFLEKNSLAKEDIVEKNIDSMVEKFEFFNIIPILNKGQHVAMKKKVTFVDTSTGFTKYLIFFPIFNIANDLAGVICMFVSEGKFNKYNQMIKNPEIDEDSAYKSSSIMRKISDLFNQD